MWSKLLVSVLVSILFFHIGYQGLLFHASTDTDCVVVSNRPYGLVELVNGNRTWWHRSVYDAVKLHPGTTVTCHYTVTGRFYMGSRELEWRWVVVDVILIILLICGYYASTELVYGHSLSPPSPSSPPSNISVNGNSDFEYEPISTDNQLNSVV